MFPFKWLWFSFIWSFENSPGQCTCRQRIFTHTGFCHSTDILASHHVDSLLDCGQLSLQSETCGGFKYRPGNDNLPNCVNFKKIENCTEYAPTSNGNADWKFYQAVHKQKSLCLNNRPCKNGGTCVDKENGFDCICNGKFSGKYCETVTGNFSSCKSLHEIGRDVPNGSYSILHQHGTRTTSMYCQMTSLKGCAGGGWTMVMKIDGSKTLFNYSSSFWTSQNGYKTHPGRFGFDDVQTKMPSFWSNSFNEICIGMKVGADLRFLTIPYAAESLRSLFDDGEFRATNVGREKWKSLIANSSLQSACYKEGFNIYVPNTEHTIARIGIVGDEGVSCNATDSFIGLGGRNNIVSPNCYAEDSTFPVSGNLASCTADNGKVNIKSMGYILIR